MADVLKRMVGPKQLENSDTLQYTAPSGGATVRDLWFSNPTTADVNLTLSIGTDGATTRLFDAYPVAAKSVFHLGVNVVLGNAETLRAHAGTSSALVAIISGVET